MSNTIINLVLGDSADITASVLTETGIAQALAVRSLSDAQARSAVGEASSLVAGLQVVGLFPVSAPTFSIQPSIAGTPQVGQALTGMDGTISNGAVVSRRWLLGAAVVSTAQTYFATAAGALVYEVTAQGPGGITVATSAATTVTVAFKPLGLVFVNLASEPFHASEVPCAYVDHSKAGGEWAAANGGTITLNDDGYPTSVSTFAQQYIPIDGPAAKSGSDQTMVIDAADVNLDIGVNGGGVTFNQIVDGRRRIEFTPNLAAIEAGRGNALAFNVSGISPHSFDRGAVAPFRVFKKSNEALLNAGRVVNDDFVAAMAAYDGIRVMDVSHAIGSGGQITDHAQYTPVTSAQWNSTTAGDAKRMPLEVQCKAANEAGLHLWTNLPFSYTDAAAIAFAATAKAALAPSSRCIIEVGDECSWNYQFPFNIGTGYFSGLYNPPIVANAEGGASTAAYGYRATQMFWAIQEAQGADSPFLPFFGTQNTADNVTRGILSGADVALGQLQATDPATAARFPEIGALIAGMGGAPYEFGNVNDGLSAADKNILAGWAADTTDAGKASMFALITNGVGLSEQQPSLVDLPQRYLAQHDEITVKRQIAMWAYETQVSTDQTAGVQDFIYGPVNHDPRMTAAVEYLGSQEVAAGFEVLGSFTHTAGGAYGNMDGAYDLTTARRIGWKALRDTPPVGAQLHIDVATSGETKVGKSPVSRITVTGGRGPKKITVTGLVSGRTFDGFRTIDGTFTQVTSQPTPATITVTDDTGSVATYILTQDVQQIVPVSPSRYFRLTFAKPEFGTRIGISELRFKDANGMTIAPTGWIGSAPGENYGGNGPGRLVDGQTNASFIQEDEGAIRPTTVIIDTGSDSAIQPASVDVCQCAEVSYFSPVGGTVEASSDGVKYYLIADRPASGGWNYTPGYVSIPLDYSGQVE